MCFITQQPDFSSLFFSGFSEEQSFLFVSQSVFGEMIVDFRERVALFGKEQARIALFPFIIILLLSPPNILSHHLLFFCPVLPCSPSPLFPFLHFFSALPTPSPLFLSPHPLSFCFLHHRLGRRVISKAANVPVGVCWREISTGRELRKPLFITVKKKETRRRECEGERVSEKDRKLCLS